MITRNGVLIPLKQVLARDRQMRTFRSAAEYLNSMREPDRCTTLREWKITIGC